MTKRPSLAGSMRVLQEDTTPKPDALVSSRKPEPAPAAEPVKTARRAPTEESAEPSKKGGKAARYAGMRMVLAPVPPAVHEELRVIVVRKGKGYTLEKAVQQAIAEFVARHG